MIKQIILGVLKQSIKIILSILLKIDTKLQFQLRQSICNDIETKRPIKSKNKRKFFKKINLRKSKNTCYFDVKINKYIRKNIFGFKEYLDPVTYNETILNIQQQNKNLEEYLNNSQIRTKK